VEKRNCADHFSRNQQGRRHHGLGAVFGEPGITGHINIVNEDSASIFAPLPRQRMYQRVASANLESAPPRAVGFRSYQPTFEKVAAPKISAAA